MIHPKELRYGNLVDFENKLVPEGKTTGVILSISSKMATGYSRYNESAELVNDFWDLEPISLTEKWLQDFGFKNRSPHDGHGAIWDLKVGDGTKWYRNLAVALMDKGYKGPGGYVLNAPTCQALKHVHQLQNLYFALTGEELILKAL